MGQGLWPSKTSISQIQTLSEFKGLVQRIFVWRQTWRDNHSYYSCWVWKFKTGCLSAFLCPISIVFNSLKVLKVIEQVSLCSLNVCVDHSLINTKEYLQIIWPLITPFWPITLKSCRPSLILSISCCFKFCVEQCWTCKLQIPYKKTFPECCQNVKTAQIVLKGINALHSSIHSSFLSIITYHPF